MKRTVCVLAGLLILFIGNGNAPAQNIMAGPIFSGGGLFPPIPGLGSCKAGKMKLIATARAGYQWIGFNFGLPTLDALDPTISAPIDIQLRDAHVWVGAVGLEAQLSPQFSFFANAESSAKTKAGVITNDSPLGTGLFSPYQWNASGLEWWELEAGASYTIFDGAAIFAALRRDHLSFGLTDPRDRFGNPINFQIGVPGLLAISEQNSADLQAKLWIPYIGLRVLGTNYRVSAIWSPFVNAAVKVPDSFVQNILIIPVPLSISQGIEWRYSMFQTGSLIEGQLEYDLRLGSNLLLSAWAQGSWLRIRGTGNLNEILNTFITTPGFTDFDALQGGQSATGTLSRSMYAVGLAAKAEF